MDPLAKYCFKIPGVGGIELLLLTGEGTTADSISQEPASILQATSHAVLQRLRRCANAVLSRRANLDFINYECLSASIVTRTRSLVWPGLESYMDYNNSLPIQQFS
jgi:hypothetical protein